MSNVSRLFPRGIKINHDNKDLIAKCLEAEFRQTNKADDRYNLIVDMSVQAEKFIRDRHLTRDERRGSTVQTFGEYEWQIENEDKKTKSGTTTEIMIKRYDEGWRLMHAGLSDNPINIAGKTIYSLNSKAINKIKELAVRSALAQIQQLTY
ncbi:hypothetical protein [Brucella thiophenivorans]|uniref:hypothetical protein n=1 Tax=Brucella thiophenivorans TaxID=571255 RepID=UPI000B992BD3|nr:hypothetical protein [Brucella thiophenivorans]